MFITLAFLLVALAIYTLFGGADFGGGILEAALWHHPNMQKKLQDTLAPIWEANHVWLIAIIVILFVGFPRFYAALCEQLFVPLSIALLGIVLRGAFFTFKKYDPEPDLRNRYYSLLFRASSMLTPLMFGVIVMALLDSFPTDKTVGTLSFLNLYVKPWITFSSLLGGLFVVCLFGYVASIFFFGEVTAPEERQIVGRRVWAFFLTTFVLGGGVLANGAVSGLVDIKRAFNPIQVTVQVLALLCLPLLYWSMKNGRIWLMRLATGLQVVCILIGWYATQYPILLQFKEGPVLTPLNSAAPPVTLFWLNVGLVVVLALVTPPLVLLYKVFSPQRDDT